MKTLVIAIAAAVIGVSGIAAKDTNIRIMLKHDSNLPGFQKNLRVAFGHSAQTLVESLDPAWKLEVRFAAHDGFPADVPGKIQTYPFHADSEAVLGREEAVCRILWTGAFLAAEEAMRITKAGKDVDTLFGGKGKLSWSAAYRSGKRPDLR